MATGRERLRQMRESQRWGETETRETETGERSWSHVK